MNFSLRLCLSYECPICKCLYPSPEDVHETLVKTAIFGSVQYAICCGCLREVEKQEMKNHWYKKRWDKRVEEINHETEISD